MRTQILITAVVTVACCVGGWQLVQSAEKPRSKPKEPDVKTMMTKAHKGKNSPLAIVKAEVKKDQPDWALLAKNAQPLVKLSLMIKDNRTYTSNPGPYVAATKQLDAAAKKHDLALARRAVAGLNKSCAGCHRP